MEIPARSFNSPAVGVRPSLRAAALRAATICFLLRAFVLGIRGALAGEDTLLPWIEMLFKETETTGKPETARQRRQAKYFIARIKYESKRYLVICTDWERFL